MDFLFELLLRLVFLPIEALLEWILENTFSRHPKLAFRLLCLFTPLCLALSRWHFGTLVWYAWLLAPIAAMLLALPVIGLWHAVSCVRLRHTPPVATPKAGKRRKR